MEEGDGEIGGVIRRMSTGWRITRWGRGFQIASAFFSLLSAAVLLILAIRIYLEVRSCEIAPQDCDQVPTLTPIPVLVILALAGGAVLVLRRRSSWLLITIWALMVAVPIGEHIYYFIPSVRLALDLPETSVATLVFVMLGDPFLLSSIIGLVLALLGLLPAHAKVRQEEPASA
jgi:hypothetical protein